MAENAHKVARIVSVVAATVISLACGTNYVYSAWAPQFAKRMKLSATQSNLIGTAGNFGMYASGIPIGLLVDAKGPRTPLIIGALTLGLGYFPLHSAYVAGPGSMSVLVLSFFSFVTGIGSCSSFAAAVKTCALNWPTHRGTATAFPLAAFGLSACVFSFLSSVVVRGDVSTFLLVLSIGTFSMVAVSGVFLRVIPHSTYSRVSGRKDSLHSDDNRLHRTKSSESRRRSEDGNSIHIKRDDEPNTLFHHRHHAIDEDADADESSSLVSKSSSSSPKADGMPYFSQGDLARQVNIQGFGLLPRIEFWLLFSSLGVLTGCGLMTINNIGNDTQALWTHYDDSVSPEFVQQQQVMHVTILSICSFLGRLASGIGSDILVKKLQKSRLWCLTASGSIFMFGQICAINIQDPRFLWAVSSLNGLGYGVLFGVYPTLVAEAFGIAGLSLNWGIFTLSAIISGNLYNLIYGAIFDAHSDILPDGERHCPDGLRCYSAAYMVTFIASLVGLGLNILCFRDEHRRREKARLLRPSDGDGEVSERSA